MGKEIIEPNKDLMNPFGEPFKMMRMSLDGNGDLSKLKSVIILGTGATREYCDFSMETWGVNGAYSLCYDPNQPKFRMDRLYMSDRLWAGEGSLNFDINSMNNFAKKYNTQMFTVHHPIKLGKHVLNAKKWDWTKLRDAFGTDYFTSSICYMLAQAIYEGYEYILLLGCDMSTKLEYFIQKAGVEFWIGYALGLGRIVEVPVDPRCAIMVPPSGVPYGDDIEYDLSIVDPDNLMGRKK